LHVQHAALRRGDGEQLPGERIAFLDALVDGLLEAGEVVVADDQVGGRIHRSSSKAGVVV